jgi:hypothetical protein
LTPHDAMALLKQLTDIGRKFVPINQKYGRKYRARNVAGVWITSNDEHPVQLDTSDERFYVHDLQHLDRRPEADYRALHEWLENGGNERVVEFLIRRWERMPEHRRRALFQAAPMTKAKQTLLDDTGDPLDAWLDLVLNTDPPAPTALPSVVSSVWLHERLVRAIRTGTEGMSRRVREPSVNELGNRLARFGVRQLRDGNPVRLPGGKRVRLWAVRDFDVFETMNVDGLAKVADCEFSDAELPTAEEVPDVAQSAGGVPQGVPGTKRRSRRDYN